jgi:hypothetical protein
VLNFKSSKDVARWLKDKPREFAVVIGARAALRVAPMLVTSLGVRGGGVERIGRKTILPTFRGLATSWVASRWPTYSAVLRDTCTASARAAGTSAAVESDSGAAYAADAAFRAAEAAAAGARPVAVAKSANAIAASAASAGYAADASIVTDNSAASNAAREAIYAAISADATALEAMANSGDRGARENAAALARLKLWQHGAPELQTSAWDRLEHILLTANPDWIVWTTWYRNRLNGDQAIEDLEIASIAIDERIWIQGPRAVNREIRKLTEQQKRQKRNQAGERNLDSQFSIAMAPKVPAQGAGPHFQLRDDGVIDFAPPIAIDRRGNNIARLRALHPIMRDLARNLVRALGHGNVPHRNLYERAQSYLSVIDQELEQILFARLYVEGIRLENASTAANAKIAEKELPPLDISAREELDSLLRLHGTFVLSTADGLTLLAVEERYRRRPHEEQELKEATLAFAQELTQRPDVIDPAAANFVLRTVEDSGKGTHPERAEVVAVSTTRNMAIVLISGATLGALPVAGSIFVGAAGLVGGGLAALVAIEGLKKTKSFLEISGLVTKGLDQLSEADLQQVMANRARVLRPLANFTLKIEPTLRRLASNRGQFSWLTAPLDWLKKRSNRDEGS